MQGVLRTWTCLNRRCSRDFDAWDATPTCPVCGCVRVNWKPGGGHVGSRARGIDAELRTLADQRGLTNLHSARAGEAAKIPHQPKVNGAEVVMQKNFGSGFASPIYRSPEQPHGVATCLPSAVPVNLKGKVRVGRALPRGSGAAAVGANTAVTHRWDGKS